MLVHKCYYEISLLHLGDISWSLILNLCEEQQVVTKEVIEEAARESLVCMPELASCFP